MIKGRVHPKLKFHSFATCHFVDRKMSGDVFRSVPEFHRQKVFHLVPLMWKSMVAMYLDV